MTRKVSPSELRDLSLDEKVRGLSAFAEEAARSEPDGEIADLDEKIGSFEKQLGLTASELRQGLASGRQEETWDICQWLMLLELRDRLASQSSRSG